MNRSRFSLVSLLLLLTMQVWAYEKDSIFIKVNGKSRNMIVFTPNTLPAKSPLMIVTHGMNQSPEYQYGADKIYEMIDTAKFVVTYLRSDGNMWDTGGTGARPRLLVGVLDGFDAHPPLHCQHAKQDCCLRTHQRHPVLGAALE